MGLAKVAHIGGGFTAWKEAGLPVADKPAKKADDPK
jgi:3-mercaptopyruvate sulfurtransferase SseA